MRSASLLILFCLMLFLMFGLFEKDGVVGQANTFEVARDSLLEAFSSIREAESQAVRPSDIAPLVNDLNRALGLQQQANSTQSPSNATLSIAISSQVSSSALSLENQAQIEGVRVRILVYSISFWAAVLSSFTLVELHRIRAFLDRRRILRTRIVFRDEKS